MKIICIEGIDAVGKETISKALKKHLELCGLRVKMLSFPRYDTHIGKTIEGILMGACGDASKLDPSLIGSIYTIDRLSFFTDKLESISKDTDYLILDRSYYSNFIYQCSKIYYNIIDSLSDEVFNLYNKLQEQGRVIYPGAIPAIIEWIDQNAKWELKDTGILTYADSVNVIVLSANENDRLKQISNRKVQDTNERNTDYLDRCRDFISLMNTPSVKNYVTNNLGDNHKFIVAIRKYYFNNVNVINVNHCNTKEEIEVESQNVSNSIMQIVEPKYVLGA